MSNGKNSALPVSVILITRNRSVMLKRAIDALQGQTLPPAEVIVVDTSDDAATEQMLAHDYSNVRCVRHPAGPRNMAWSRNQGINASHAPIIAFLDDDSIAERQWSAELIRAYANDPTIGGVGGRIIEGLAAPVHVTPDKKVSEVDACGMTYASFNAITDGVVEAEHLKGCNMSFRREVLAQIGNFDEAFNGPVRDETDVCVRVRRAGYRLMFNPDATVEHFGHTLFAHKRVQLESVQSGYLVSRLDAYYVAKNFGVPAWTRWYLKSNIRAFARALKVTYMAFARATLSLGGGVVGLAQASRRHSTGVTAPSLQGVTEAADTPLPSLSGRGE